MSITFIFCELQTHHHVALSPLAIKEIKPRRLGRAGGFSFPVRLPWRSTKGCAFLKARKLHVAPQWVKGKGEPLASWKWQPGNGKVARRSLLPSEGSREARGETVMCLRGCTGMNCWPAFLPSLSCPSVLRCSIGPRKPLLWPLESSI